MPFLVTVCFLLSQNLSTSTLNILSKRKFNSKQYGPSQRVTRSLYAHTLADSWRNFGGSTEDVMEAMAALSDTDLDGTIELVSDVDLSATFNTDQQSSRLTDEDANLLNKTVTPPPPSKSNRSSVATAEGISRKNSVIANKRYSLSPPNMYTSSQRNSRLSPPSSPRMSPRNSFSMKNDPSGNIPEIKIGVSDGFGNPVVQTPRTSTARRNDRTNNVPEVKIGVSDGYGNPVVETPRTSTAKRNDRTSKSQKNDRSGVNKDVKKRVSEGCGKSAVQTTRTSTTKKNDRTNSIKDAKRGVSVGCGKSAVQIPRTSTTRKNDQIGCNEDPKIGVSVGCGNSAVQIPRTSTTQRNDQIGCNQDPEIGVSFGCGNSAVQTSKTSTPRKTEIMKDSLASFANSIQSEACQATPDVDVMLDSIRGLTQAVAHNCDLSQYKSSGRAIVEKTNAMISSVSPERSSRSPQLNACCEAATESSGSRRSSIDRKLAAAQSSRANADHIKIIIEQNSAAQAPLRVKDLSPRTTSDITAEMAKLRQENLSMPCTTNTSNRSSIDECQCATSPILNPPSTGLGCCQDKVRVLVR